MQYILAITEVQQDGLSKKIYSNITDESLDECKQV